MVDILSEIKGADFDQAWLGRHEATIGKRSALTASFINREDLIAVKKAAGRFQDAADVAALQKAKEAGQKQPKRKPRKR